MTDHDHDLTDRLARAVDGLRAPDVLAGAMAQGRRQRTRRRLAYGAGAVAAMTALAVGVPALAGGPTDPPVVADPTTDAPSPAPTRLPPTSQPTDVPCDGEATTGWWSRSSEDVAAELATLLPARVTVGRTDDDAAGLWGGNLVSDGDPDFASLTLLPPPGIAGGRVTMQQQADGSVCTTGSSGPMQDVKPCTELTGYTTCEEILADGLLVGVVTERVEQTVVDGQDQPTDKTYVLATVAAPGGGFVELYVAEGTRADRPSTVHDPADVPVLTMAQAREIVSDPVWTS